MSAVLRYVFSAALIAFAGLGVYEIAADFSHEQSLSNTFFFFAAPFGWLIAVLFVVTYFRKPVGMWRPLELAEGEEIVWERRASHQQNWRAVGGKLFLTNQRMVFKVSKVDAFFLTRDWSIERNAVESTSIIDRNFAAAPFAGGIRRRLQVSLSDGSKQLFVINGLDEAVAKLRRQMA